MIGRRAIVMSAVAARRFASSAKAQRFGTGGGAAGTGSVAAAGIGAATAAVLLFSSQDTLRAAAPAVDYAALREDIGELIDADTAKNGDGTSIGPTLVRLAWHASGTYSKVDGTGGSNGATMRFPPEASWGANAGLGKARAALEPLKAKYPGISYADLWTFAGAAAIEHLGGPTIAWRPGRADMANPTTVPDGRLPDADKGCLKGTIQHVRDVFGRMGFTDREMVALIGAHALGRCHVEASGYWGPWSNAETTFSNDYYKQLTDETWTLKTMHQGKKWEGPDQFENADGAIMMLPADMALLWDKKFRKIVEEFAGDEEVFFKEFSSAFSKLLELGVPFPSGGGGGIMAAVNGYVNKLLKMIGLA